MRGLLALALMLTGATVQPARAQPIIVSAAPETVSVSIYRAPDRGAAEAISRQSPQGYALITERRTITVPAGRSKIRFEGVAGNIFPESAIVTGLPVGVREKNLDADLLSPRSLYDRALGRRIMIRRTDPATGRAREEQAVVRSGANGAAVLQTGAGFEALHCAGLSEALVYDGVPAGLSTKPTLSIEVDSPGSATATVTLSYLAGGFDWQADYVIQMRQGGVSADIVAWITLASSDVTSFVGAGAQVIAGKPNRESSPGFGTFTPPALRLRCWPIGRSPPPPPPPPPPPVMMAPAPMMAMEARAESIIVTAARLARQEELGDLKLYRIADPVTVASQAQKQVGLLAKAGVRVAIVYVSTVSGGYADGPVHTLRARNRVDAGLGLALPAGKAIVFDSNDTRPVLVGEASTDDKAIGEDVEFKLGVAPGVGIDIATLPTKQGRTVRYRLTVSNANPWPIAYEAKFANAGGQTLLAGRLGKRNGLPLWSVTVPANGKVKLDYVVRADR